MSEIEAYRSHLLRLRGTIKYELDRAIQCGEGKIITLASGQIVLLDMLIADYERMVMREAPLPTSGARLLSFMEEQI